MDIIITDPTTTPKRVPFSSIAIGSMFILESNDAQIEGYFIKVATMQAFVLENAVYIKEAYKALGWPEHRIDRERLTLMEHHAKCIPLELKQIDAWVVGDTNANTVPKGDD